MALQNILTFRARNLVYLVCEKFTSILINIMGAIYAYASTHVRAYTHMCVQMCKCVRIETRTHIQTDRQTYTHT